MLMNNNDEGKDQIKVAHNMLPPNGAIVALCRRSKRWAKG